MNKLLVSIIGLLSLLFAGCASLPANLGAHRLPNRVVTIINSSNANIVGGAVSGLTATPSETVWVVNSQNQVMDTLGSNTSCTTAGSSILKGNGSGGCTNAVPGVDYQTPIAGNTLAAHQFANSISSAGVISGPQPQFTDIGGTATAGQGGTGLASPTAHSVPITEGSSPVNLITATLAGDLIVDQGAGNDFALEALHGDCTMTALGAITCTKTNGTLLGTFATQSSPTGSTQCLHANAAGVVTGTGSDCGTAGGSGTVNSGTLGQLAYYASTGTAVSGNANATIANGTLTLGQSSSVLGDILLSGSTSGLVTVQPQAIAGTYNFNLPTGAGTAGQPLLSGGGGSAAQTYGTLGIAAGGTNNTTAPSAAQILIANGGATAFVPQSVSGDCTLTAAGVITCTKSSGTTIGTFAFQTVPTGGGTQCLHASNAGVVSGTGGDCGFPSGGTATQVLTSNAGSASTFQSQPVRLSPYIFGTPSTSSAIWAMQCADSLVFPTNLAGSYPDANSVASCGTNPTASESYTLKINGSNAGTMTLSGSPGPVKVQTTTNQSGTATLTLGPITTTAGNTLIIMYNESSTQNFGATPITDNRGTHLTYNPCPTFGSAPAIQAGSFNSASQAWYAQDPVGGSITITITLASSEAQGGVLAEFSGIPTSSAGDGSAGCTAVTGAKDSGSTTTALSSGNASTSQNFDVVFGFVGVNQSSASFTAGPTNSFATLATATGGGGETLTSAFLVPSTNPGPFSTGWTDGTAADFAGIAFALKSSNTTPGCTPTFVTATSGPCNGSGVCTCAANQRMELDSPGSTTSANLAVTLAGHTP